MKSPIQRQMEIFSAALEHPAGPERDAFLAQACAADNTLLACVQELLAGHSRAGSFLAQPAGPVGPTGTHLLPSTEKPGDKIGRYKLLQQIGEGGCGTVYMAEQEEPVRRRVALKVIRLGMDTKSVVARFEAERQALALMDHPNIAKVFDGGATDSGRPYFVMELVRGIKITDYCDQAQLSTTERLKLFIQVCQAVQHAHQKGIIHRDIKPSNILVTVNDGVAVPKVIDFGIAKATDQRLTDKSYFTEFHAFIGTPAYTSPEQAEMSSLDIDTRSDIYSLGVLLYELLTGQTPFPSERLMQSGLDEMRRIIREEEPPRPSTCLTTLPLADASELSRKRQIKIPALAHAVEGDIDWIVMKALEKDRARRYATSLDFAADLQRHLSSEAVLARPPSLAYKFQRAVRRNKGAFAAAAAVFLTLLTGLSLTAWQAVRAKNAEQAARSAEFAARGDRDRAVLAESNATTHAIEATNALQTANERMVKLNVAEGWRRVEEGDHFGALLPFAEAFALEQDKPDRAEIHQMRLASLLQRSPKLVNVWSVGTNINHAEFSRDGTRLLVSSTTSDFRSETQTWARVFDSVTGHPLMGPMEHRHRINSVVWNDDETHILTASSDRTARVWDAATGHPLGSPMTHEGPVLRARFGPDGTNVLTFAVRRIAPTSWHNDALLMWNFRNSALIWSNQIPAYSPQYNPALVSPDATTVMTSYELFDAANGKLLKSSYRESSATQKALALDSSWAPEAERPVEEVAGGHYDQVAHAAEFSPDGSRLFINHGSDVNGYDAYVTLRDGKDITRVLKRWPSQGQPTRARFNRDSSRLATANEDATVRIWNAADGSPVTSPLEHGGFVADVRFSSDGAWLASGTGVLAEEEGYAQVWDVASGKPLTPRLPHDGPVLRVAFSKDNSRLLVVGERGTVAEWNLAGFGVPRFTWPMPGLSEQKWAGGTLLNDEGTVMATMQGNTASAWNLGDGTKFLPSFLTGDQIGVVGRNLIEGGYFGIWSVTDLQTGQRVRHDISSQFVTTNKIHAQQSSVGGRWITAHQGDGGNVLVLDALTGQVAARLDCAGLSNIISRLMVHPDGKQVIAVDEAGKVAFWNVGSSNLPAWVSRGSLHPEKFSPRGQWIKCGGNRILHFQTHREVFSDKDDDVIVESFSPDDAWVLCWYDSISGTRFASVTNRSMVSPLLQHRGEAWFSVFSADSRFVISAGSDLMARYWSVPTAEPIVLPTSLPSTAWYIKTTADGRGFITVHTDDTLRFWELPKTKRPVSAWLALARFFAQGRGDGNRSADFQSAVSPISNRQGVAHSTTPVTNTSASARPASGGLETRDTADKMSAPRSFRDEWQALRAKHPEVFTVSADELDAWHRHEAWRCESRKDWSNAVHHLTELLKTQPDSGDFLPRRAAACVAMADSLLSLAPGFNPVSTNGAITPAASAASRLPEAVKTAPDPATPNTGLKPGANDRAVANTNARSAPVPGRSNADETKGVETSNPVDPANASAPEDRRTPAATSYLERALADYNRTLAWVDRFPAIAKESRKPFVEKRREVYLKLGRKTEAEADERELKLR